MNVTSGLQCRLCLNRLYNMKNVILEPKVVDYDLTIPESIYTFFGVQIDKHDIYSKFVCANCLTLILLIHKNRKVFQDKQKLLVPLVKEEKKEEKDEESPPPLEPYFSSKQPENPQKDDSCEKNDVDYINVPKAFFKRSRCLMVKFNDDDRHLADLAFYGSRIRNKTEKKRKKIKENYLKHVYNKGPGVIRELIQDKAKQDIYISEIIEDNRVRSIYEYDVNLRPNEYDNNFWTVGQQLSVFVCPWCNDVFYTVNKLNLHQKIHEKFKTKMNILSVVL